MNEKYVTSLELSKRLKEVGYKQEGVFWWLEHKKEKGVHFITEFRSKGELYRKQAERLYNVYVAPTTDELLERLPDRLDGIGFIKVVKFGKQYEVNYANIHNQVADTPYNALAKMYIYLVENGLIGKE